jgi:hypothetical protein
MGICARLEIRLIPNGIKFDTRSGIMAIPNAKIVEAIAIERNLICIKIQENRIFVKNRRYN